MTDEHREYHRSTSGFSRVKVLRPLVRTSGTSSRGMGAVELAARFSLADFASSNLPVSSTPTKSSMGTILYEGTLGLNWYLNDYTRLTLN